MIPALLLISVVASALFAGLETGVVSLNRIRLRVRARRGDRQASTLLRWAGEPERVLTTFLVGNTLCNVGGGALASAWAVRALQSEGAGSLLATLVMSAVFLVFSELTPKAYFRARANQAVPRFAWFIRGSMTVFAPISWLSARLLRLISGPDAGKALVTREELRQLVREARGRLGARERHMLESVFDFGHTVAREVMLPLPEVVMISETAEVPSLLDLARRQRFTRFPVFRDRVDAVVGLVSVFDVLYEEGSRPSVADYVRPIHIVPETAPIQRLLLDLQRRRETMALVVNEFGACVGIVTVEDIIEEITGELADEHEEVDRPIQSSGDGYVIDASLDVDDLNDELGLALSKERFETVGGLLLHEFGRIPQVGERVKVGSVRFEILTVHRYGVRRVHLRILQGGQGE